MYYQYFALGMILGPCCLIYSMFVLRNRKLNYALYSGFLYNCCTWVWAINIVVTEDSALIG